MKYGETLRQRSIPAWSTHNIDYDDVKHFIKEHTTPGQGKTIAVPGRGDEQLASLENDLFIILRSQHDRIDLFVRSKSGEIRSRLEHARRKLRQLATRQNSVVTQRHILAGRLAKYSTLEDDVTKTGDEIKSLARFVAAQRTAFRKLLKKHKKWTGSMGLENRFRDEVLDDPKSFTQLDLGPLLDEYSATLQNIRTLFEGSVSSPFDAPKLGRHDSAASAVSVTGNSTIRRLQDAIDSQSKVTFDTSIATAPLGSEGTFASFFVHPENLVELQIFLLQHAEYYCGRSRSNSVASPISPSLSRSNSYLGLPSQPDFHMVVADSLDRFAKEQSAMTVNDREQLKGSYPQRTKACVRWNPDEHAMACLRLKSGKAKSAALKRKHARAFFDRNALFSADQSAATEESDEEVNNVRQEFVKDASVQPLFHFSSCRSRFTGLEGTAASSQTVTMATLDTKITIDSADHEYKPQNKIEFPFALLLVRQEGSTDSGLLTALDHSHLVERVRGFSLEYHAVWALHKPKDMPAPFWLPMLNQDIRKLPPPTIRQNSMSGSGSGSGREPESRGSITAVESSTAVDTPFSSLRLHTPPSRSARKHKRILHEEPVVEQPQGRYWNEYDDPEDEHEDPNAFALYFDPNEKSTLDRFFERVGKWFGLKSDSMSILDSPDTPPGEDDGTSSDEEAGLLGASRPQTRKKQHSNWGTFSSSTTRPHARTSSASATSPAVLALRETQAAFVPKFATICFVAANFILMLAYMLALTGRKKYLHEVDAGVFSAVIASVVFVIVGFLSILRVGLTAISLPAWAICIVLLVLDAVASGGLVAWMLRAG